MISFTEAQAQALVTDAGTLKRGQELLKPTKWANLGRTDAAAWGACAGSGSKPYLTGIDLTEPAFKCSCPSRVFPCKHGAGLLLLLARQPELFAGSTPPVWLEEWLGKRQQTQEKKTEKAPGSTAASAPKGVSKAAPLHGENAPSGSPALLERGLGGEVLPEAEPPPSGLTVDPRRLARMAAGANDLAAWLEDLMRAGLATLDQQPARLWESQAARLVDNQLPGLAATLRELATLRHAHPDWPTRLLARLGELYLLVRAFRNLSNLGPDARPEILQQVGVNLKKEDLLATAAPLADAWQVLGQFRWEEDRLTARRTWLRGRHSGRPALVLEFAFGSQPFATPLIPQGSYLGELVFYPGLLPLRAAPVSLKFDGTLPPGTEPAGQPISQLLHDYAAALARQPWLREWPATLTQVLPTPLPDGRWLLRHASEAHTLPLRFAEENAPYELLAQSGGQSITLFGEWDGRAFRPLSSWAETSRDRSEASIVSENAEEPETLVEASSGASSPGEGRPGGEVAWPQLLRMALLGTRQSNEILPSFPGLLTPDSPEEQLLLNAGALALMQKAGYRPAAASGPALAPAPPEQRPALGPKAADSLQQMVGNSLFLNLLPGYLRQVADRGRRVPHAMLVPLLKHAARSPETRAALGPVLGSRGRWLAAQNPEWAKLLDTISAAEPTDDSTAWETGSLPERLAWLRRRFTQEPAAARALLLAALPTEPAKTQEALLEILAEHLHPAAEPALENLLKARGQEVRRLAAELLVRLPGAALTGRLWARAAPLITAKRKLLGLGKAALEIALPPAWEKSWLLDGVEEKNDRYAYRISPDDRAQATVGPAAGRLGNLVALLPPQRWTAHLGLSPSELLTAALASEWAIPLLPCWSQSTVLHRDVEFAKAFLLLWQQERPALQKARCDQNMHWSDLAAVLPPAARQALLLDPIMQRVRRREANWYTEPAYVPAPWPRNFSAAVLDALAATLANSAAQPLFNNAAYQYRELIWLPSQIIAPRLAPADIGWAVQRLAAIAEVHDTFQPQFDTFVSSLRFQAALDAALSE